MQSVQTLQRYLAINSISKQTKSKSLTRLERLTSESVFTPSAPVNKPPAGIFEFERQISHLPFLSFSIPFASTFSAIFRNVLFPQRFYIDSNEGPIVTTTRKGRERIRYTADIEVIDEQTFDDRASLKQRDISKMLLDNEFCTKEPYIPA
jgi:hypothetical protein